jgi:hypothetical protein
MKKHTAPTKVGAKPQHFLREIFSEKKLKDRQERILKEKEKYV